MGSISPKLVWWIKNKLRYLGVGFKKDYISSDMTVPSEKEYFEDSNINKVFQSQWKEKEFVFQGKDIWLKAQNYYQKAKMNFV